MTRARAALPLAALALLALAGLTSPAWAQSGPVLFAAPHSRAILFVMDGATFSQVMAGPEFRQLARAGGVGLMTTAVPGPDIERSSYLTIGAGAKTSSDDPALGSRMADALALAGVPTCVVDPDPSDPASLLLPSKHAGSLAAFDCRDQPATASILSIVSVPTTDAAGDPAAAGDFVRRTVQAGPEEATLVVVVVPEPSHAMVLAGDETPALIVAQGLPSKLFPANGPMHGLTSGTTRYEGLTANVDVAPTVLSYFSAPIPGEMDGLGVRITGGPAPFGLYHREAGYRHVRFIVQVVEGAFVVAAGLFAYAMLWLHHRRGGLSGRWRFAMRYFALAGTALPLAALTGGLLGSYTYLTAALLLVGVMAALPALALRFGGRMRAPLGPYRFVGAAGLALFAVDAAFGFHAMRVQLEGGVMFDGVRFYGLTNTALGPLLASALVVGTAWTPGAGTALLGAAALLAGLPWLGADVGGAITLSFAAGLWWCLRARGRIGPRELFVIGAATVGGLAVVLLISRFAPGSPTHATHFVERTGGLGSLLSSVWHRLGIGLHEFVRFPEAAAPLVLLPVLTWAATRRRWPFGHAFDDTRLRHVLVVLAATSIVAYFVNDTGLTAGAPMFLYATTLGVYAVFTAAPQRERMTT